MSSDKFENVGLYFTRETTRYLTPFQRKIDFARTERVFHPPIQVGLEERVPGKCWARHLSGFVQGWTDYVLKDC